MVNKNNINLQSNGMRMMKIGPHLTGNTTADVIKTI